MADLYPAPAGQPAGDKDSRWIFAAHHREGPGDVETVTGVEGNPLLYRIQTEGLVEIGGYSG